MDIPRSLPEGALVLLKSGGPLMTTEKMRGTTPIVPVVWFSADGMCHRDAFHIEELAIVGMPYKQPDEHNELIMEIAKEAVAKRQADEDIANASRE